MVVKSGLQKFVVEIPGFKILGLKKIRVGYSSVWLKKIPELKILGLRCHATFLRTFLAVMVQNKKIIYIAHHNIQF